MAVAVAVAVLGLGGAAAAAPSHSRSARRYLLALGDSLAAGYQPTDGNNLPPVDPASGQRDQGYPGGYASVLARRYGLSLVDLGCPGETSSSFSTTPAQAACASFYREWLGSSNQQAAARRFLAGHRGQVALVTIDIGANDLDGCASSKSVDFSCLATGEKAIATELPRILASLKEQIAADDRGTPLVSMNYYDPYLAEAYSPGGATGSAEATASVAGLAAVNTTLLGIDAASGVIDTDVAAAFHTDKVLPFQRYGGRRLPADVVTVCRLTWMCPTAASAVKRPDVHPNSRGYAVIARAFEAALARHHARL